MSLPWFRMYAEFAKDAKVQSMDETLQRRLVMLFCLKCSDELELSHDELACALRISGEEMETTLEVFRRKGFMDEDDNIVNWDKRQFASDNSTDRVRRYRERQRNGDETLQARSGNGAVTPPDTDTDTDTDIDTDTDTEKKNSRPNGARVPSRHIDLVFHHWQEVHGHPEAKPSEKRRRLISQRLKEYTLEELREAISGYALSPFHMGDNDNGRKYDSLELILRDAKQVEQGMQFARSPPTKPAGGQRKTKFEQIFGSDDG